MTEYTLTSPKWEGDIRLKFYDNGFLASAEMPEVIDRAVMVYFATAYPVHVSVLDYYREKSKITITKLQADVSFAAFWESYNQKRGSKEQARQYWEGEKKTINRRPITLTDRENIMNMVAKYSRRYKGDKKEFQPLATSFLHGRMWEAELENTSRKEAINLIDIITKRQNNG